MKTFLRSTRSLTLLAALSMGSLAFATGCTLGADGVAAPEESTVIAEPKLAHVDPSAIDTLPEQALATEEALGAKGSAGVLPEQAPATEEALGAKPAVMSAPGGSTETNAHLASDAASSEKPVVVCYLTVGVTGSAFQWDGKDYFNADGDALSAVETYFTNQAVPFHVDCPDLPPPVRGVSPMPGRV